MEGDGGVAGRGCVGTASTAATEDEEAARLCLIGHEMMRASIGRVKVDFEEAMGAVAAVRSVAIGIAIVDRGKEGRDWRGASQYIYYRWRLIG